MGLQGIRVVDLTSILSGPFCTWLLSTLGADVIKVESLAGDTARLTPPFEQDVSLYFASLNRNKRSLALDLKSEAGQAALQRLLASADVFIENMRPGVRDRLGCGDAELERINPRLIRASISGFGQQGSLASQPAYDIVVQAMSGMMSINGPPGGPPTRVGFSTGDISAALFATIGILERLYQRDARGQEKTPGLDVSMLACQWVSLENAFARYLNAGVVAAPLGSRHPSMTPFDVYPTADRDIVIALGSYLDWPRFCEALELPDLIEDERFKMDEKRIEYSDSLDEILAQRLRSQSAQHWVELLLEQSIPCSVVENVESIANSPIADEYHAFSKVTTASGSMEFVRNPIADPKLQETAAPAPGQHNREILRELGYSESEIETMEAK